MLKKLNLSDFTSLSKFSFKTLTKLQLQNFNETSASKSRPNFSHHCIEAYRHCPEKAIVWHWVTILFAHSQNLSSLLNRSYFFKLLIVAKVSYWQGKTMIGLRWWLKSFAKTASPNEWVDHFFLQNSFSFEQNAWEKSSDVICIWSCVDHLAFIFQMAMWCVIGSAAIG